ncbi:hypothetical protein IAQ61_002989 [Plenodomus lingam]|uniref:Non-structural maintenance of chromosomes element 1 homolog n=1 Tax=Leptosphaeria maculans (strain JN3 / isolate v23.1.3 / race Av1-4-5-6-7-8) TaxID=985895 RepID=E5A835_LEPMJ|nr:hypothetical protein LEMA_P073690.1 [Plenodomus lingam JN3]KAH9877621.1 hypothetical protein IAQ61_002989 [Plenodomus lingam]CBX99780.1 hypothetical protein LEMA_P073690.1 [Plenodomus lingam JN3]
MSRDDSPIVRPVSDDEDYNWTHRAFLQAFQTHSVMTVEVMKATLAAILTAQNPERPWSEADITQPQLTNAIQTINAKLEAFDFEIRNTRDQRDRSVLYALVNNTSDSLTQFATKFSAAEIAYIRRLLDYMFDTNNTRTREVMAVKHTEASQLARPSRRNRHSQFSGPTADEEANTQTQSQTHTSSSDPGITIQEADTILTTLVQQALLQKSRQGYFSLAPRALMELRAYLKETYNESVDDADETDDANGSSLARIRIHDCEGCREIVTYGIRCNRRECGVRWHDACANGFYRGKGREGRKCPGCGTECSGDVYVGERADRVAAGGRRGMLARDEDEEEEEE